MSQEQKTSLLEVIEYAAQKLKIDSKSKLYLKICEAMEQHLVKENDDWLEAAKPQVIIHRVKQDCQACEG